MARVAPDSSVQVEAGANPTGVDGPLSKVRVLHLASP